MSRPRTINHEEVVSFASANPGMPGSQVAKHFGVNQSHISRIMKAAGIAAERQGRRAPKRRAGHAEEEHSWEKILCRAGLGMDRGLKIGGHRIFYGYEDPTRLVRSYR